MTDADPTRAVCVDVGSTWTKAALVNGDGTVAGFAEHPTTVADVLTGMDAAVRAVTAAGAPGCEPSLLACSSAGGGLRLAVIGTEQLAATEAGYGVAVSAGCRVVFVHGGELDPAGIRRLRTVRPGVLLVVGGADGEDPAVLLHNAGRLATARVRYPIVLAGNADARSDALALLRAAGCTVTACDNVAPERGVLAPNPARAALTRLYLRHALGGRGPAAGPRFRRQVRFVTPDVVGRATEVLARLHGGRVLVVDVGCATTGVYAAGGDGPAARTVEGDLGLRSAVAGVLEGGQAEGIVDPLEADLLRPTVDRMSGEIGYVPRSPGGAAEDRRLAAVAAVVAVRRHLRSGASAQPRLLVLTGGVFRRYDPAGGLGAVGTTLRTDPELAAALAPAALALDAAFTVVPAGLLAANGRVAAAEAVLRENLLD
ncbi:glutamate mutase L [Pseudonocardia sp.]|uniref:glutamate mutase L n=1 Tax=Pseudonocardia sp. TaxID=60912 RepID=UPI003D0D967B